MYYCCHGDYSYSSARHFPLNLFLFLNLVRVGVNNLMLGIEGLSVYKT